MGLWWLHEVSASSKVLAGTDPETMEPETGEMVRCGIRVSVEEIMTEGGVGGIIKGGPGEVRGTVRRGVDMMD